MTQERGSARTIALEPGTCCPKKHMPAAAAFAGQESAERIAIALAVQQRLDRKLVARRSVELKVQHCALISAARLAPFHECQGLSETEVGMQHRGQ